MRYQRADAPVPPSGRFLRHAPEFQLWLDQLTGWRLMGCPGPAPDAPDLLHAIEVWQDGVMTSCGPMQVYEHDMRGVDLSKQDDVIVAHYMGKRPSHGLWAWLNCTLPGDDYPMVGALDIEGELVKSVTRLLSISRGEKNEHVAEVLHELLQPVAVELARVLQSLTIRASGPNSPKEVE